MGYKDLKNFQEIFEREDFNYISGSNKIDEIGYTIRKILYPLDNDQKGECVEKIKEFMENLTSFYEFLTNSSEKKKVDNSEVDKSYTIIYGTLASCVRLFWEPDERRKSISKNYVRKFNKEFIYGLTQLLKGIRNAFEPENISSTGIDRDQLVRYILEKKEGLGKKFQFNDSSETYAFAKKINTLSKRDLILTERLLVRLFERQVRTINGWMDLGSNRDRVRILCVVRRRSIIDKLRKSLIARVYYLFLVTEHTEYEQKLKKESPNEAFFKAA